MLDQMRDQMRDRMHALPPFITRWRAPRPLLLAADGLWDLAQGTQHADFAAWCSAHPRARCTLWLGSGWLTDLVCDAGAPLQSPPLRAAWARRVLAHYHGDAAAAWALLPWRRHAALGASALHGVPLQALRDTAAAQGVQLTAVRPLWPHLLDRLLAHRPALRRATAARALLLEGGADGALLTVVTLASGRVVAVSRRRLQPATADGLHALLQEDTAAQGSPAAALLMGAPPMLGLALDVVESLHPPYRGWLPRVAAATSDFLHPSPRVSALGWAWLGTALLVLGVAALDASSAWQARAQAFAVVQPAAPRLNVNRPVVVVQTSPADAVLRTRQAHPWHDVFLATEAPAAAGLVWLSMDHAPGGELRLQGLAADADTVHRVANTLRNRPAWRQVLVSRLERQPQGQVVSQVPGQGQVQGQVPVPVRGPGPVPGPGPGPGPDPGQAFEIVARLTEVAP